MPYLNRRIDVDLRKLGEPDYGNKVSFPMHRERIAETSVGELSGEAIAATAGRVDDYLVL